MRKYFLDDAETIERWRFAAGFAGIMLAWFVVLAVNFGII